MPAPSDDMSRTAKALRAVAGMTLDSASRTRLRQIVGVLGKYGLLRNPSPEQLKSALEELGPTFVKLGQMVSSHADVFPVEYCNVLASLRSRTSPLPFEECERLLDQAYEGDYHTVFTSLEPVPLGSASIAQVHRAVLKTGETVAVKIQRPGIKATLLDDLSLMRKAADLLEASEYMGQGFDASVFIDELERTVQDEIDFRKEAETLREFHLNCADRRGISSPKVYPELSSETILVMEYVQGRSFEHLDDLREQYSEGELARIGRRIVHNYLQQMIEDGLFHADPHPANLMMCDGDVVWIDLGMVGRLAQSERAMLRRMFLAVAMSDAAGLKTTLLAWGHATRDVDHARLLRDLDGLLSRYATRDIANLDLSNGMNDLLGMLRDQHIAMPGAFMTLARGLMTLQGTVQGISPTISVADTLVHYLRGSAFTEQDLAKRLERALADAYYAVDKGVKIPQQVSDTLNMLEKGELQVNASMRDLQGPVEALRRSIGIMALGIIVAGLFIGSSTLCTTQMEPRILGVPIIGCLGYLCAFVLGVYCVWKVHKSERKKRRGGRR